MNSTETVVVVLILSGLGTCLWALWQRRKKHVIIVKVPANIKKELHRLGVHTDLSKEGEDYDSTESQ